MGANFTPTFGVYGPLTPFRYWCQKVLPLTYDDSLSYYELLNKVVDYLNKTMEDVETLHDDTEAMLAAFNQLQTYVNTYFDELDLTEQVQIVLDRMAENGSLDELLRPIVGEQIGGVVAEQIDDAVAGQIYNAVASQINNAIVNVLNGSTIVQDSVEGWLDEHIPTGDVVVDNTLSINGAAANSSTVGDKLKGLKDSIEHDEITFTVLAGNSHSSTIDQMIISVPINGYYRITNTGAPKPATVIEVDSNGNTYTQSDRVPVNGSNLYKASINIDKIGVYIPAQTDNYTAKYSVDMIGGLYDTTYKNKLHIFGIENALNCPNVVWTKGVIQAAGGVNTADAGATSSIIKNATGLMLKSTCRAVIGAYKGQTYIGKLNSSGGFDKLSGNWGYLTEYIDIASLLSDVGADGVQISVLPLDGTIIRDSTVQTYGDEQAIIFENFTTEYSVKYINWWMRGAINSDGSNSVSTTRLRSDFIPLDGADRVDISFQSGFWISYSFYGSINLDSFISQSSVWIETNITLTVPDGANYVRIVLRYANNDTITLDDYIQNSVIMKCHISIISRERFESELPIVQENTIIKTINHRGYNSDAPENTLPAYKLSRKHGFKYVETDVAFTSDGVAVCLHDETINRTARNTDGTVIPETIYIKNITYAEALTYDFGIWKGSEYAGTKIPTYKEWLLLCKKLSLHPVTEIKNGDFSQEQASVLANIVKSVGMENDVSFISFIPNALTYMKAYFPNAWMALAPNGAYSTELFNTLITNINSLKTMGDAPIVASVNYDNMTSELYSQLSNAGIASLVWTVDQSEKLTNIDDSVVAVLSDTIRAGTIIEEYALT